MFTCPDCGGVMWEIQDGNLIKYRCHVGHVYSSENYLAEQAEALEFALWASVRSLEERATILRRLAKMAGQSSGSRTAQLYEQHAQENEVNAKIIRNLLLSRNTEAADISKIPRHKMTSASHPPANTPGED
jgi:two-component system chemotaxis response regulator CheB